MGDDEPAVFVVDDDQSIREGLTSRLRALGWRVFNFDSARSFLSAKLPDSPSCLILDLYLPGGSGLDLQRELAAHGGPPIVFISGTADIASSVKAIKGGALDVLPEPFGEWELANAVRAAIEKDREARRRSAELAKLRNSYGRLSPREREVFCLLVEGLTNGESAAKLGIAEITVQVHRAHVMRKMAADSIPKLVRMATKLNVA